MRAEQRFHRAMARRRPVLSVVVPLRNEEAVLPAFYDRLAAVLGKLAVPAEIVFVNDGSTDGTLALIDGLRRKNPNIAAVDLSRNFGKEIAMTAGLDFSQGDAVVVIDADLQDPPEVIPRLFAKWREGYDVVYAVRTARDGESFLKKFTARGFYRVMRTVGSVRIPMDTGDFRLLSRRAVDALMQLRERHRFMKGLFTWIGYRQIGVPYHREARGAGHSNWNYWKLWNFALEGITSFTTTPLKIATYVGFSTAIAAFLYGLVMVFRTLAYGNPVAGYPSLMTVILFLGGVQLMSIGVIGEYLSRMFDESKHRPLYLVNTYEAAASFRQPDYKAPVEHVSYNHER
jgi:glycosyltransferase involved in cell wall biosynthesis